MQTHFAHRHHHCRYRHYHHCRRHHRHRHCHRHDRHHHHHRHDDDQVKPLVQWEKLDMSSLERRKLCCSVTFHAVSILINSIILMMILMMIIIIMLMTNILNLKRRKCTFVLFSRHVLSLRSPSLALCGPSMF